MAKYGKKIVEQIVSLVKADTYTIGEICRMVGIGEKTWNNWVNEHSEFAAAIEKAKSELMESLVIEAKKSMRKKIKGYDATETRVLAIPDKDGNPKIKQQITIKKHVPPDTAAIIFALTNGDPQTWKNNRNAVEVTGKDGKDLFASMTDDELDAKIEDMKRKLDM